MKKATLSVSIITFNESDNIARTLESVRALADEIIVVDSRSVDDTCEKAENFGAKVFVEDWKGHVAQKNSALEKCSCEFALCLDADEPLDSNLRASISDFLEKPGSDAAIIDRRTFYLGKTLNYAWRPDRKLRLVRLSLKPRWGGLDPHDKLEIDSKKIVTLKGSVIHYSYKDLDHHFRKTIDYARISAGVYHARGKRASWANLVINPIYAFARLYFIDLGFVDGLRGLIAAFSSMTGTFLKYAFLKDLEWRSVKK